MLNVRGDTFRILRNIPAPTNQIVFTREYKLKISEDAPLTPFSPTPRDERAGVCVPRRYVVDNGVEKLLSKRLHYGAERRSGRLRCRPLFPMTEIMPET